MKTNILLFLYKNCTVRLTKLNYNIKRARLSYTNKVVSFNYFKTVVFFLIVGRKMLGFYLTIRVFAEHETLDVCTLNIFTKIRNYAIVSIP